MQNQVLSLLKQTDGYLSGEEISGLQSGRR